MSDGPNERDRSDDPAPARRGSLRRGGSREWWRLHLWQIQFVRDVLAVAAVVGLVWLGYKLRVVTVPLLLALLLAYLFEPLVRKLTRRGHFSRRGTALGIIAAVVLVVLVPLSVATGYAVVQTVGFANSLAGDIRLVLKSVDQPKDDRLRDNVRPGAWRDIRDWLVERNKPEASPPPPRRVLRIPARVRRPPPKARSRPRPLRTKKRSPTGSLRPSRRKVPSHPRLRSPSGAHPQRT